MSFSYKIIKNVNVQDGLLKTLPLRCYKAEETLQKKKNGGNGASGARENLQAWAVAQADETISRAKATAEEIIREARLESEQIEQQAYRDGFDRGVREGNEQGYQEGMEKAERDATAIRAQAQEVLEQAEKSRRRTLEALEGEVIDLAREIAEKFLSAQLTLDPEAVLHVAGESLRLVADRLHVVLYVNPTELTLVENKKEQLQSLLPARAEFQVIADPSIRPGGCKVETEQGQVDASVEKRKEELLRVLYGE